VEEEQVEVVVYAVNRHPLLPLEKGEPGSKLENERFHLTQDSGLEVPLGIHILQAEEIQKVRVSEDQVGGQLVALAQRLYFDLSQFLRLPRKGSALKKHGLNFLLQRARVPAFYATHLRVEFATK
jgi:hypothetical protein